MDNQSSCMRIPAIALQNIFCLAIGAARVTTLETVIFWLVLIWTPGLGLMAYLLLRRSPETD
jgi:hypothetical protein